MLPWNVCYFADCKIDFKRDHRVTVRTSEVSVLIT